jgi:hypothetical protein
MPANQSSTLTDLNSSKALDTSALNSSKIKSRKANSAVSAVTSIARPILLTPQNENQQTASQKLSGHRRKPVASANAPMLVPMPAISAVTAVAPARQALALLPTENEDSIITGMTRSLHRRLLGLNLPQVYAATQAAVSPQPATLTLPARRKPERSLAAAVAGSSAGRRTGLGHAEQPRIA